MNELKENMIEEINDYIRETGDFEIEGFLSKEIIDYEKENNLELMWWPTEFDEKGFVLDIAIEKV